MRNYIKYLYLVVFIISLFVIFNITNDMLKVGFDSAIGQMQAMDKRLGWGLISLFGLVGFFSEVIIKRLTNIKDVEKGSE